MSQSIFALLLFVIALAFKGGIALNILTAGNALFGNQTEYLSNSGYYLVMQQDCNLVMYHGSSLATSHQVWQASTAGKGSDCWLIMQTDGNLVLYNETSAQWDSNSFMWESVGDPSFFAMLQSSGELDVYNFQNDNPRLHKIAVPVTSLSPTSTPPSFITSLATIPTLSFYGPYMAIGYYLPQMSSLQNGPFSLTLATDCTLQSKIGSNNTVLWETPSNASGLEQQCELTLQQDANLQIQTSDTNEILWTTNTTGNSSVNWVLYIDSITGDLSIGDIMQPTDILWKNTLRSNNTIVPCPNTHSGKWFILELLGVSAGGFLLGITSLVLTYYVCTRFINPAQKELQQRLQNSGGKCQALTLTQIKQATQNFKTTIGIGGFGKVYYGKLVNGQEIAVKTLSTTSHQTKQEFFNEVITSWRANQIIELIDPNIEDDFNEMEFSKLVELSLLCVMKKSNDRPSMTQVVQMLREFHLEQLDLEHYEDSDNNEHTPYVRPSIPSTSSLESTGTSYAKELKDITPLSMSDSLSNGIEMTKLSDQS
ncbi:hypothetical protein CY35_03G008000 [Sphagnum magellanicum]|nr:hypothetical protein CY35_03G008000 [Sphagnum magellanicum]